MAGDIIPVANPGAQFTHYEAEIREAVARVLASGSYILGDEVAGFEKEFATFHGVKCCVGVANGTDALAIALKAVGVGPGDEVITVSHSAVATVAAIEQIGAVPVFSDIHPLTRCIDADAIPGLATDRTKALVPVHIYGQPAPMREIVSLAKRLGLKIVEDCAQAHGAELDGVKVGCFGDAAAFSFYPTKNLGAIGDGGAIITKSEEIGARACALREYGWEKRFVSSFSGFNSRLDELQAAILRVKLPHLQDDNARRRKTAQSYNDSIRDERILPPPQIAGALHSMHLYVVECEERDELKEFLHRRGIGTGIHYPYAIHQQPAYKGRIRGCDRLPVTESLYRNILSLPMYPELTPEQVGRVCRALEEWSSHRK